MTNYNKYGEVVLKVAKATGNPKDNWKTVKKYKVANDLFRQVAEDS